MKKLIITLLVVLIIPTMLFSQDKQMKKLFNNYKNVSGFSLETSTSDMDIDLGTNSDFTKLLNNIKEIYILKFDNDKANSQSIDKFEKEINKLIDKNSYNSLFDISSDGVFKMLIKRDKNDEPTDLVIITKGDTDSMYLWATQ